MSAIIQMDHLAGTSIDRACEDACRVANLLGVGVEFRFNEVRCVAWPQGSSKHLAHEWQHQLSRELRSPYDTRNAVTNSEAVLKWLRSEDWT